MRFVFKRLKEADSYFGESLLFSIMDVTKTGGDLSVCIGPVTDVCMLYLVVCYKNTLF